MKKLSEATLDMIKEFHHSEDKKNKPSDLKEIKIQADTRMSHLQQ
jgi:hypothetical protein